MHQIKLRETVIFHCKHALAILGWSNGLRWYTSASKFNLTMLLVLDIMKGMLINALRVVVICKWIMSDFKSSSTFLKLQIYFSMSFIHFFFSLSLSNSRQICMVLLQSSAIYSAHQSWYFCYVSHHLTTVLHIFHISEWNFLSQEYCSLSVTVFIFSPPISLLNSLWKSDCHCKWLLIIVLE